jgi:hypothetical protein
VRFRAFVTPNSGDNWNVKSKPYSFDPVTDEVELETRDLGPSSAGQSGDTQGLSSGDEETSESVSELIEEGQYFEAGILSGIENAPPADVSEVRVHQFLEDDVPEEYRNSDEPSTR